MRGDVLGTVWRQSQKQSTKNRDCKSPSWIRPCRRRMGSALTNLDHLLRQLVSTRWAEVRSSAGAYLLLRLLAAPRVGKHGQIGIRLLFKS